MPPIARGIPTVETALTTGCVSAYRKTWGNEGCIILMNIDENSAVVDLTAYADWTLAASLSAEGSETTMQGSALQLPAWGVAVLTPTP